MDVIYGINFLKYGLKTHLTITTNMDKVFELV